MLQRAVSGPHECKIGTETRFRGLAPTDYLCEYGRAPNCQHEAAAGSSSTGSAAEKLHLCPCGHEVCAAICTPRAVLLAETDDRPTWACWLVRAGRLWRKHRLQQTQPERQPAAAGSGNQCCAGGAKTVLWARLFACSPAAAGCCQTWPASHAISLRAVPDGCRRQQQELLPAVAFHDGSSKLLDASKLHPTSASQQLVGAKLGRTPAA